MLVAHSGLFVLLTVHYAISFNITRVGRQTSRQSRCSSGQFRCTNGQCIDETTVCDGPKECADGSDETLATCSKLSIQCPAYAFRCAYGACVDRSSKCNGRQDCADNSDELLPECRKASAPSLAGSTCQEGEFKCTSGQCIDEFSVCDGYSDCKDGSDETITQCVNIRCPPFTFQCAYGACIERKKKCDKKKDCSDGSDEDPELCKKVKPPPTPKPPVTQPPNVDLSVPVESGQCRLPYFPEGGNYTVKNCKKGDRSNKCKPVPGTPVDSLATILEFACHQGYSLPENTRIIFCNNGLWEPEVPKCLKLCKPLISSSVDVSCKYRGDPVSCENPLRPGTRAETKCKSGYHIGDFSETFSETLCKPDGEWDYVLFRCVPDCGKPNKNEAQTLISYGTEVTLGEYPWHTGLYILDPEQKIFVQVCGGTLITPHIVLTAAHCVYVETLLSKRNESDVKVAVGKINRSWYIQDPKQQSRDVREIIIPAKYEGSPTSYAQDIALLDLVASIILSAVTMPACLDRGTSSMGFYVPPEGTLGVAVGWGLTENGTSSEMLLSAQLPYIPDDECRRKAPGSFRRFITYDKFCAGWQNGTGVQPGDSGGGLTFWKNETNQFAVYGVVSLKKKEEKTFALFTNVSEHIKWIDQVSKAFRFKHPQ